jgi:tetratricopeptide (TPR) repeat protein
VQDDLGAAVPEGDVYAWYRRGLDLLEAGDAAAAAQLLRHAVTAEPSAPSLREALARAEFDAGHYADAVESFRRLVDAEPDNDYALFGLGLAESRLGEFVAAAEHLALAAAMRPDRAPYAEALRQVRATVRAREVAEGGPQGIDG